MFSMGVKTFLGHWGYSPYNKGSYDPTYNGPSKTPLLERQIRQERTFQEGCRDGHPEGHLLWAQWLSKALEDAHKQEGSWVLAFSLGFCWLLVFQQKVCFLLKGIC